MNYSKFQILNLATKKTVTYPYIKGMDNRDVENKAIKEQMEINNQPRADFMIHGLIK